MEWKAIPWEAFELWYTAFGYDEGIAGGTGCTWRRGLQWASPVVTVKAEGKVSICAPLTVSGEGLQLYQPLFGTANKPLHKIPSRDRQKSSTSQQTWKRCLQNTAISDFEISTEQYKKVAFKPWATFGIPVIICKILNTWPFKRKRQDKPPSLKIFKTRMSNFNLFQRQHRLFCFRTYLYKMNTDLTYDTLTLPIRT